MAIEYPYEIESSEGGWWVFRADDDGMLIASDGTVEPSPHRCSEMVEAIESGHWAWPSGSCVYHGPLRKERR